MLPMSCPSEKNLHRQFFDRQVKRFIECGYAEVLRWTERDFRFYLSMLVDPPTGLLDEVGETTFGHIPFLVVIPHATLSIDKQMQLLAFGKKRGYASLDSGKLWNSEGIGESKSPYLICDVDDGTGNVGRTTGEATGEINRACRHGLTMEEGIALAVHFPESLAHHAFALTGSHYQGSSSDGTRGPNLAPHCVPELWLSSGGPAQSYSWLDSRREDRGVPSCHRRLFLEK